ncbi:hypothetical protein [Kriegella aquimaris]|uniref:Uncharacterized protein n=1 Tax=Kriegella aquimaris TaxID=192904 RepID=A0A1G9IIC1_9FLAO|nr:hypothetical protein [Kriegella aquimaris]SDL24940.1 hypothetical protein SAMN04488514_101152 [Kriegella aquimaris]
MTTEKKSNQKGTKHLKNDKKQIGMQIRKQDIASKDIGKHLKVAASKSKNAIYSFTRDLIGTQQTKEQFLDETQRLFDASIKLTAPERKMVLSGVLDQAGQAGSLFVIQNISALKKKDARTCMKDFMEAGGSMPDIAVWLQYAGQVLRKHRVKSPETANIVVDALDDAAEWLVDALEDTVDGIVEAVDAIIDAATNIGEGLARLFEKVVAWTAEQIGDMLAALIEAGRELGEFIGAVFVWTYNQASKFVEAAFAVGYTIADILKTVVSESYFVMRRFVNGIIKNLGPISDIFNFVLDQAENATSALWRSTLLAVRYAKGRLMSALDWVATQSQMALEGMLRAWESIGEALSTFYEWANTTGTLIWEKIGIATAAIGNSFYYAYHFLTTSAIPFIFDYTRGLLDAGIAIAGLISWAVTETVEACAEVIRAGLDAGLTIGNMLVEIAQDPGNALGIFIQGMQDIGQTLDDLFQAVIIDTAEEFLEEVVAMLIELREAVQDMLMATLRLGAAAFATLIAHLFCLLGSYRGLRPEEEADARLVFGNSLDYQNVFLSTEDPLNFIIFGIQDLWTKEPQSRAFVTINLINFDVSDGTIDRPTLIHELTHIWQSKEVGGIYMAEAAIAQTDLGSGYNYGYADSNVPVANSLTINDRYDGITTNHRNLGRILGRNGETALNDANGDFEAFNREQQGQIMMHWFVRKHLTLLDTVGNPVVFDTAAFDPYQQFVFNS